MTNSQFRLGYGACLKILLERTKESAPGRLQLLTGPRQVGKTTLLLELASRLGPGVIYAAADGPEATLPGFWERAWSSADATIAAHGRAVVLLDEVHLLPDWAARLKGQWDRIRRRRLPVAVVATGSSALRLARGSRESLAGRFERLTLAHWPARGLVEAFGVEPDEAAATVVRLGAYPGAFALRDDRARWSAYVRDAILEPAIGRDLLALGPCGNPGCCGRCSARPCPARPRSCRSRRSRANSRIRAPSRPSPTTSRCSKTRTLVAAVPKFSARALRQRAAPPKLVVLSNALLAAVDPQGPPDAGRGPGALRRLGRERLPGARLERRAATAVLARGAARGRRRSSTAAGARGRSR